MFQHITTILFNGITGVFENPSLGYQLFHFFDIIVVGHKHGWALVMGQTSSRRPMTSVQQKVLSPRVGFRKDSKFGLQRGVEMRCKEIAMHNRNRRKLVRAHLADLKVCLQHFNIMQYLITGRNDLIRS